MHILDFVLGGGPREEIVVKIHDYVQDMALKAKNGELPLKAFEITKGLNKDPKDYPDKVRGPDMYIIHFSSLVTDSLLYMRLTEYLKKEGKRILCCAIIRYYLSSITIV